jgi:hypothetical protein
MGSFLEKGDGLYWEKQARGLFRLFDKIDKLIDKNYGHLVYNEEVKSIRKRIRYFRNVFTEK